MDSPKDKNFEIESVLNTDYANRMDIKTKRNRDIDALIKSSKYGIKPGIKRSLKSDYFPANLNQSHHIFTLTRNIICRLNDENEVKAWNEARTSSDPDMVSRWTHAVEVLESGLQHLRNNEVGICFCYDVGMNFESEGICPLGDPLPYLREGRLVSNRWLLVNGIFEFQFSTPTAETLILLLQVWKEDFQSHPYFNKEQSWENYKDLIDKIRDKEGY